MLSGRYGREVLAFKSAVSDPDRFPLTYVAFRQIDVNLSRSNEGSTGEDDELANALHRLSGALIRLGQHDDALKVAEEAVGVWRDLASINARQHNEGLALSLGQLGHRPWSTRAV